MLNQAIKPLRLRLRCVLLPALLKLMLWTVRANGIKPLSLKDQQITVRLSEFILWAGILNGMKQYLAPISALTLGLEVNVILDQRVMKRLKMYV
jgi:hypothetical protein